VSQQTAKPAPETALYALTIVVGLAVWLIPWLFLGRREAWDHWSYFSVSLPIMALVAGYAGFRAGSRWWRWPLSLIVAQYVAALVLAGTLGNLFPLGIVAFAIFGVPLVITAWIGALLGKRREQRAS
jgi:hypothetical protein